MADSKSKFLSIYKIVKERKISDETAEKTISSLVSSHRAKGGTTFSKFLAEYLRKLREQLGEPFCKFYEIRKGDKEEGHRMELFNKDTYFINLVEDNLGVL